MRAVGGARVVMEKRMPLLPMSTRACRWVAACFRGDEEAIFAFYRGLFLVCVSVLELDVPDLVSFVVWPQRMGIVSLGVDFAQKL